MDTKNKIMMTVAFLVLLTVLFFPTGLIRILDEVVCWWKKPQKRHWITTTLGLCAMLLGLWSFKVHWIPYQSLYFNLVYGEVPSIGLIFAGWIGLHAADGRHIK